MQYKLYLSPFLNDINSNIISIQVVNYSERLAHKGYKRDY